MLRQKQFCANVPRRIDDLHEIAFGRDEQLRHGKRCPRRRAVKNELPPCSARTPIGSRHPSMKSSIAGAAIWPAELCGRNRPMIVLRSPFHRRVSPRYIMSLLAELLRLSMKAWKLSKSKRRHISMAKVRSRLRLIEQIVPQPPSGTKSSTIDVDGIKAIEILVPEARTDTMTQMLGERPQ